MPNQQQDPKEFIECKYDWVIVVTLPNGQVRCHKYNGRGCDLLRGAISSYHNEIGKEVSTDKIVVIAENTADGYCAYTFDNNSLKIYMAPCFTANIDIDHIANHEINIVQFEKKGKNMPDNKPTIQLTGQDGNVFNLIGIAQKALRRAGQGNKATEMAARIQECGDYHKAINIISEYCDIQ